MKPMNGSVVGSERKAGASKTNKAKKAKLTDDSNQTTSSEASTYEANEQLQRQLSLLINKAVRNQDSNETESSTSDISQSSVSARVLQVLESQKLTSK